MTEFFCLRCQEPRQEKNESRREYPEDLFDPELIAKAEKTYGEEIASCCLECECQDFYCLRCNEPREAGDDAEEWGVWGFNDFDLVAVREDPQIKGRVEARCVYCTSYYCWKCQEFRSNYHAGDGALDNNLSGDKLREFLHKYNIDTQGECPHCD